MARHILCADGAEKQWGLDEGRMKVLNLYAGIGGNRKLWEDVEVTAVEINPDIAAIYKEFFPGDEVIVADAHEYLLNHFEEYDFIWSSPPCPTHSTLRKRLSVSTGAKPVYPDMKLYEEILLLKGYFKGKWAIENVEPWYEPLLRPQKADRHHFWANFIIPPLKLKRKALGVSGRLSTELKVTQDQIDRLQEDLGFDLSGKSISGYGKGIVTLLRNCVHPKLGLHVLDCARKGKQSTINQWKEQREVIDNEGKGIN